MKKIRKVILIPMCILMLTMLVSCNTFTNNVEDNSGEQIVDNNQKQNTKKIIAGKRQVGNIEFSNIVIELVENNRCRVTADIKNTSEEFLTSKDIEIRVKNEKGETEDIFGDITKQLAGYETNTFITYVRKDITYVKDIEIVEIKN